MNAPLMFPRDLLFAILTFACTHSFAFGDTLGEALNSAFNNDPRLKAERTSVEMAKEGVAKAKSSRRFQLSLSGSAGYEWSDTNRFDDFTLPGVPADSEFPGVDSGARETAGVQAEASYPLYAGGRLANSVRLAEADHQRAKSQFQRALQDLYLRVVTVYVQVRQNEETVRIRQRNVGALTEQLKEAKTRYSLGVATKTDVALAEARLAGAKASLAGAQSQYEASKVSYHTIVGKSAVNLIDVPPAPQIPAKLEDALETGFANAPEILSARNLLRSAEISVEIAKGLTRPEINFSLGAGVQNNLKDDLQDESASAVIRGRIPLYQGGGNSSSVKSAKLRRKQARQSLDAVEWELRASVSQSWFGYQAAVRMVSASAAQVHAAELAYEGSKIELDAGVRSTLDLLNQEQELLEARLSNLSAMSDAYILAHQLLRSIGGLKFDSFSQQ